MSHSKEYTVVPFQGNLQAGCYPTNVRKTLQISTGENVFGQTKLTHEDVKSTLHEHLSKKLICLDKNMAKEMKIKSVEFSSVSKVILETFTEKRMNRSVNIAYDGGLVDDYLSGVAPAVWQIIPQTQPVNFKDANWITKIPHTEYLKVCNSCTNNGQVICKLCAGKGVKLCKHCCDTGKVNGAVCIHCKGCGRKLCKGCESTGYQRCSRCKGTGHTKFYQELLVEWKTNKSQQTFNPSKIPGSKLDSGLGDIVYEEIGHQAVPINCSNDAEISKASDSLISQHTNDFGEQRCIMQKQMVIVIPYAEINCEYKKKPRKFYIYGNKRKVHMVSENRMCNLM